MSTSGSVDCLSVDHVAAYQDECAERATGIEPAWPAWKAGALPLSYARMPRGGGAAPAYPLPAPPWDVCGG
jgi:hypothetical protein